MDRTKIEWTDATWNPVTGCTKVSPGCDHCYAETIAHRFAGTKAYPDGFDVTLHPERLDQPLRWTKPRRVFVNSMSDLFHDDIPDEYIARVWAVMASAYRHTFQVLTKRHGRMRSLLSSDRFVEMFDREWCSIPDWAERSPDPEFIPAGHTYHLGKGPLSNVWLGVSVENQQWADIRIPALLQTPAAVRFLSCEPLLGHVELLTSHCPEHDSPGGMCTFSCPRRKRLDWVIVGGESGKDARPMHPEWARSLRDQCSSAGVPFHFKQWGEYVKVEPRNGQLGDVWVLGEGGHPPYPWAPRTEGAEAHRWGPHRDELMRRVGKKQAGRDLDRRTWDEFPEGAIA